MKCNFIHIDMFPQRTSASCLRDQDYRWDEDPYAPDANPWSVYACVTDTINIEAGISPVATTAFKSNNVHRTHTTWPVFDVDAQEPSNTQRPNVFLAVKGGRIDSHSSSTPRTFCIYFYMRPRIIYRPKEIWFTDLFHIYVLDAHVTIMCQCVCCVSVLLGNDNTSTATTESSM